MDFGFSDEQEILRETVRDFARTEIEPNRRRWEEEQHLPREIFRRMGELGFMGVLVEGDYGGPGLGYLEYVLVIEELSRVDGAVGLSVAAHNSLCSNHIRLMGSEPQKRRYLPGLVDGSRIGAWALTEPGSGSDAAGAASLARRVGDEWILNGTKNFCTNAGYADVFVVLAVTDPEKKPRGFSAFIVEKGSPGLIPGEKEDKLGCRASDTTSLRLDDCRVPSGNLLGREGEGFREALKVLDGGRVSIAAMAVGIARGALECGLEYSQEREQFGRPIAEFQAIQWKLADMATRTEAAALLTYQAAWFKEKSGTVPRYSSMAKLYAGEVAVWVAEQAIQIHGGYGYIKDYPPEKYWRDAKVCTIGEGTSEIQRLVIARELLKASGRSSTALQGE